MSQVYVWMVGPLKEIKEMQHSKLDFRYTEFGALLQLNKVSRRTTNGSGSQEMGSGLKIQI